MKLYLYLFDENEIYVIFFKEKSDYKKLSILVLYL
jgi:hypothetical protein